MFASIEPWVIFVPPTISWTTKRSEREEMGHDARISKEAASEHFLFRYLEAFEHGDFDELEEVITAALEDPELDRLIVEANRDLHDEDGLSPLAEDAKRVRTLLRQTIPSGFIEEGELPPITIGVVAARLRQDRRLSQSDRAFIRRLVGDERPVPPSVDRAAVGQLAAAIGGGSEAFWRRFRDAAIMIWLGQGHQRTQLAATRRTKARALGEQSPIWGKPGSPQRASPAKVDSGQAVRHVYEAAGSDPDRVGAPVAPLDDLIATYPIRHEEIAGLTYAKAADFLKAQTGQTISIPERQAGELAGFIFCVIEGDSLLGCILVNRDDPVVRRRFSAAHEFGHYFQHFLPLLARPRRETDIALLWEGLTYPEGEDAPSGTIEGAQTVPATGPESMLLGGDQRELEANQFAAELLMPEAACRAAVARHQARFGRGAPVRLLASEFLVSQEAMTRRLGELGLLNAMTADA